MSRLRQTYPFLQQYPSYLMAAAEGQVQQLQGADISKVLYYRTADRFVVRHWEIVGESRTRCETGG